MVESNRQIKKRLEEAVFNKTLPQVLLFHGPKGVGKSACARSLAAKILDDTAGRVLQNTHPDLQELSSQEQGYAIEAVRAFCASTSTPPFLASRKVALFHEADQLSIPAQNALLKTLEEPSSGMIFFLITEKKAALLPTILSRSACFAFQKMGEAEGVCTLLSSDQISPREAKRAWRLADGSLLEAQKILEGKNLLLPQVIDLLSHSAYLPYLERAKKIAQLPEEERSPLFTYILFWYRDLAWGPEHFLQEELPDALCIRPFQEIFSLVEQLQSAWRLHMKVEDCLEILFFEVLEHRS